MEYEPTWESLDQRPVVPWWRDAKLGVYLHLVVEVPKLSVDKVLCPYAYVLKVAPVKRGG